MQFRMKNSEKDSPKISVIIVNWNTKALLRECLRSLNLAGRLRHLKIIVADNASSDESSKMVRDEFPEAQLINTGANVGFGKANNLALKTCQSPYVLFLNPDTVVKEGAHWKMLDFLEDHREVGAIGSKMVFEDGEIQPLGLQWFPNPITEFFSLLFITTRSRRWLRRFLPVHDPLVSGEVKKLYGGCMMVRKKVLDTVGFFDERFFMYAEDVDLSRRIRDAGWKLFYMAEASIVHHCGGATLNTVNGFSVLMKCESAFNLMEKYHGWVGAQLFRIAILAGSVARLLFLIIRDVLPTGPCTREKEASKKKYVLMLRWSLFLEKPIVVG